MYIDSEIISQAQVYNYETKKTGTVYDWDKLTGYDPYDFFLSGPSALLRIENPKAAEKKTAEKKITAKKAEEKAPAKKTTAKKTTTKKTTAKKSTAKKEIKVSAFVEYYGKQVEEKEIIARVKKAWTSSGNKIGDIKTMDLYIKPEESAVYYVINGTSTGAVAF